MIGITTCRRPKDDILEMAKKRSVELNIPYFPRADSLNELADSQFLDGLIVYGAKPYFWTAEETYAFHLGTAALRILQMKRGASDRLCRHIDCKPGLRILDCTFGRGGDAAVLSWYVGPSGQVVSLEKSKAPYEMGRLGLSSFSEGSPDVLSALRRIKLCNEDFHSYLHSQEDNSFDYVYFDTMFVHPVKRKENRIEGFRKAACYDQLDEEVLREASRVASSKVIVKERPFSKVFKNLLFTTVQVHPGQSTAYGVICVCQNKSL